MLSTNPKFDIYFFLLTPLSLSSSLDVVFGCQIDTACVCGLHVILTQNVYIRFPSVNNVQCVVFKPKVLTQLLKANFYIKTLCFVWHWFSYAEKRSLDQ